MTKPVTKAVAAAPTTSTLFPALRDLGLAPENPRFDEPADEDIPRLAETLFSAGVVIPLAVRPGRDGEQPFMVLDGRRRRLGLLHLLEAGRIDETYPVKCELFESAEGQVAAALLPNIEHAPTHLADVIQAIRALRKAKMSTKEIGAALGYEELEIKRLERLSHVHPKVLRAFRGGRLTLRQVRAFTRMSDKRLQGELAQQALDGYLQDWQLTRAVSGDRLTVEDPRMALVGVKRYRAAGGRVEVDLFGETPDRLLDAEALTTAWEDRIKPIVAALRDRHGLKVYTAAQRGYGTPDGFLRLPYVYRHELAAEAKAALADAEAAIEAASAGVDAAALLGDAPEAAILPLLEAELARAAAPLAGRAIGAVILTPDGDQGLSAEYFAVDAPEPEIDQDAETDEEEDDEPEASGGSRFSIEPKIPALSVTADVEGVNHALHEVRTDLATRGLIRDLADDPSAALTVLIAQMFKSMALRSYAGESASTISARKYAQTGYSPVPALDGEIRTRLDARLEAFAASGQRPIGWVGDLPHGEKMSLLAELVALSLNLVEARTSSVRREARAEAAEIAELCGADIATHWTPDARYLGAHNKPMLMGMLTEMQIEDSRTKGMKKDGLVVFTAEAAAERGWAPKVLSWQAGLVDPESAGVGPEETSEDPDIGEEQAETEDGPDTAQIAA